MLPLIEREVVSKRLWIEGREFVDMLALAQVVPGPVSLNAAVFVGRRMAGLRGAVVAVAGIVLPAFLVMLAIVLFLIGFRDHPAVAAVFGGLRPAVAALIVATVPRLARKAKLRFAGIVMALAVAFMLVQPWVRISPAWVVAAAFLWAFLRPPARES